MGKIRLFIFLLFHCLVWTQDRETLKFQTNIEYSQEVVDSILTNPKLNVNLPELKKILLSDSKLLGWTAYYKGMASRVSRERKYDSTIFYGKKGISFFENSLEKRTFDQEYLVPIYNLIGYAYNYGKRDYQMAINYYQKGLKLNKKLPFKYVAYMYTGIGSAHKSMGNDSLAISYLKKAILDTTYTKIPRAYITTLTKIGTLYQKLNKVDSALIYYRKSNSLSYRLEHTSNIASNYGYIGEIFINQGKYEKAATEYKNSLKAISEFGLGNYHGAKEEELFAKGFLDYYNGNFDSSVSHFKNIIDIINSYETFTEEDRNIYQNVYEILKEIYIKKNDVYSIVRMTQKYLAYNENYRIAQLRENLNDLELRYQTREKDNMISQLEISEAQNEKLINQQRLINYGLIGFIILIVGLTYLFIRQNRLRSQYQTVNLEQRLLRSQMNPHFLGNAMNTISSLASKNSPKTVEVVQKISHLFRQILNNSREEFVTIEVEQQTIEAYLELQSDFSKKFNYEVSVNNHLDTESVCIPPMFIQPIVENAIIHGFASSNDGYLKINFDLIEAKGLLCVTVEDNGSGIETNTKDELKTKYGSVSGSIINERLEILKKKFKVDAKMGISSSNTGTTVQLFLPYILDQ